MPRFNGMGPMGMGPMTGWGRGYCRPRGIGGRGMGYGYGYGYRASYGRGVGGYGQWGAYPISEDEERGILENEKAYLKSRLNEIDDILGGQSK